MSKTHLFLGGGCWQVGEPCKYMYVLPDVTEPTQSEAPAHSGPRGAWPGSGEDQERDGDWTCPACSANCYAKKTECFKCGTRRPAGMGISLSSADQLAKYQQQGLKDGEWRCAKCGVNVFATKSSCFKCHALRPGGADGAASKKPRLA